VDCAALQRTIPGRVRLRTAKEIAVNRENALSFARVRLLWLLLGFRRSMNFEFLQPQQKNPKMNAQNNREIQWTRCHLRCHYSILDKPKIR
jgi:hypothetical protein